MDLFEFLGVDIPEEQLKKKEVKKETKKETKKTAKAETPVGMVHRIVDLHTGFCTWVPEIGDGKTFDELKQMYQKEYPGAPHLYECGTASQLRVMIPRQYLSHPAAENDVVPEGTIVAFGAYQNVTDSEMTVKQALQEFVEEFPEFESCKAYIERDKEHTYLCPYIVKADKEPAITFPVTMGFGNELVTLDNVPNTSDYEGYMKKEYEKAYHAKVSGFHYQEELQRWLPVLAAGNNASTNSAQKTAEKKEKKYKLPVDVRLSLQTITFTKDNFPEGTEEVTAEEVRQELEKRYFEYSKDRTVMEYNEVHNCLIAILKSSSKGADRIENTGFGRMVLDEENRQLVSVEYQLPKIPAELLDEVVRIGKSRLPLETAYQLFWDLQEKQYILYIPEQKATPGSVEVQRNHEMEFQYVLVADIHTHGLLPAFFSATDNADELGWRLYMVIGNLGGEEVGMHLRAGANGCFKPLLVGDYFSQETDATYVVMNHD